MPYRPDMDPEVRDWLLDTDPALRWQVERDLLDEPEPVWRATRELMATEGMAARLLRLQDPDGQWAGGAFFPTRRDPRALVTPGDEDQPLCQPWTATTWTLATLREWGLDAALLAGTAERLTTVRWEYDDLPYWGGEVDACINAKTLATGAWLGADIEPIVTWFVEHQLPDGGWNCEWVEGSTRSSFHSTINSLAGILWWEQHTGRDDLRDARHRAEEYLLERRLMYRLSSGEPVGPWVRLLHYPFRAVYSSLRALDHLRRASATDGAPPDPRAAEAVEVLRSQRHEDGRWYQGYRLPGERWFEIDVPVGEPSPWLTLHALRVLRWWDAGQRS